MSYLYFIGIDISKDNFEVALHNPQIKEKSKTHSFANNKTGFKKLMAFLEHPANQYFITLEATGGYETSLLLFLCANGFAVHRLQTLKSAHYMRSLRVFGKNDVLDAQALARFGAERHESLTVFVPLSDDMLALQTLSARRDDLVSMLVTEKQRLKHPNYVSLKDELEAHCQFLTNSIKKIDARIAEIIENAQDLKQRKAIMKEIKGVGEQTANILLTMCPELGTLTRRQVASLAGVAPHPKQSGTYQGYRCTKGGRSQVKRALFMAVLSAKSYNPTLKQFFDRLVANGKKKMVALTATMRKLITIINAKIRDAIKSNQSSNQSQTHNPLAST